MASWTWACWRCGCPERPWRGGRGPLTSSLILWSWDPSPLRRHRRPLGTCLSCSSSSPSRQSGAQLSTQSVVEFLGAAIKGLGDTCVLFSRYTTGCVTENSLKLYTHISFFATCDLGVADEKTHVSNLLEQNSLAKKTRLVLVTEF